jgi:ABC-type bacteriocin/lantibiotic exporter with double-glycine peptidase domain
MKRTFANMWKTLTPPERAGFKTCVCLDVAISLLDIAFLAALIFVVQWCMQPVDSHPLSRLFQPGSLLPFGIFFAAFSVKNAGAVLIVKRQYRYNGAVAVRLSKENLASFQRADYGHFVNVDTAKLIRQINIQPFDFCQYILSGMQQMFTQAFLVSVSVGAILVYNGRLFMFLLLVLLPPVVAVFILMKRAQQRSRGEIRATNERSLQALLDAVKGYIESNLYGSRSFFLHRYTTARERFSRVYFRTISIQTMPGRIIESFAILGLLLLLAISRTESAGTGFVLTIGTFMAAAYKIIPGLVKLINLAGQMKAYEFSFAPAVPRRHEEGPARPATQIRSVGLRNVTFRHGDRPVVDNVNLLIEPGDFIGISGQSGIGKTTVLNLVLGFLRPGAGTVLVNGTPRTAEQLQAFWPGISYARQQPFLMQDSIRRNITFETTPLQESRFRAVLRATSLDAVVAAFPEGAERIIAEDGRDLSGGQQQRICLARAFYKDADLFLLDEPFNELDEDSVTRLLTYCRSLAAAGKMIVMISHHERSLSFCTKTLTLHGPRKNAHHTDARVSAV